MILSDLEISQFIRLRRRRDRPRRRLLGLGSAISGLVEVLEAGEQGRDRSLRLLISGRAPDRVCKWGYARATNRRAHHHRSAPWWRGSILA